MAISVDKVYKTVLSILNKESRGFITPDEFNKVANQVQLELFEKYFVFLQGVVIFFTFPVLASLLVD